MMTKINFYVRYKPETFDESSNLQQTNLSKKVIYLVLPVSQYGLIKR